MLAAYACDPAQSRGRRFAQPPTPTRTEYQRDRDRIVHSSAFRRLVYKTQVFLNHEGDLFRTRLTHSLEVAQLGRSIARSLALNEDLVEAIALAHDLGHTPFGHAGQDALNECMAAFGGFEHNLQSLRVVDRLEERYPQFDGLNLSFETREGILKHCSRAHAEQLERDEPGGVGRRFLARTQPSLEAQLCNLADEIAYNAHDIDDGVRSGLITLEQLVDIALFEEFRRQVVAEYPHLQAQTQDRRLLYETIRRMLSAQVYDVIAATSAALQRAEELLVEVGIRELSLRPAGGDHQVDVGEALLVNRHLDRLGKRHPDDFGDRRSRIRHQLPAEAGVRLEALPDQGIDLGTIGRCHVHSSPLGLIPSWPTK